MVVKDWEPGLTWHEIDLESTPLWMQIHGLPMDRSNEQTGHNIGKLVGRVI